MRVCRILNQVVAAGPKMANGAGRSAIISKRLRKVRQGGGGYSDTAETRAGKERKKKKGISGIKGLRQVNSTGEERDFVQHTATVEGHVGGSAPVVLLETLLLDQLLSHDVASSKQDLR